MNSAREILFLGIALLSSTQAVSFSFRQLFNLLSAFLDFSRKMRSKTNAEDREAIFAFSARRVKRNE